MLVFKLPDGVLTVNFILLVSWFIAGFVACIVYYMATRKKKGIDWFYAVILGCGIVSLAVVAVALIEAVIDMDKEP